MSETQDQTPRPTETWPLDEAAHRKPDFTEDDVNWCEMADGQLWALPKPVVKFHYSRNELGFGRRFSHGLEFAALIERDEGATQFLDRVSAQLEIAAFLLRLRYDLTDEQVGRLVEFEYEKDVEDDPIRWGVMRTAYGYGAPKPTTAGSD